jgi:hypothetical protein
MDCRAKDPDPGDVEHSLIKNHQTRQDATAPCIADLPGARHSALRRNCTDSKMPV